LLSAPLTPIKPVMPSHVLTLIAGDRGRDGIVETAKAIAASLGAAPDWLAPETACDLFFDGDATEAGRIARNAIDSHGIDFVIQPTAERRKKLLVADMESTIIDNEMLNEMADLIGIGDRVAEVTRRAMNGELDFAASIKARVALFKDRPTRILSDAADRIRFMPGARTLVATMRKHGAQAVLVSGGFYIFSRPVRDTLGFDRDYANELLIDDERIVGAVREPILDSAAKRAHLLECAAEFGVPQGGILAVGDGANDLPMLHEAGLGIAYHAKPHVRAQIGNRIDHADLTALLYLQGYRAADLVG
jgi:phosphoserine phosphatase